MLNRFCQVWASRPPQLVVEEDVADDIRMLLDVLKPRSVIDIGCGEGRFYPILSDNGRRFYLGIDLCKPKITAYAKPRSPNGEFLVADFFNFESPIKFDLAFTACFICLPEIKGRLTSFIRKIKDLAWNYLCYEGYSGLEGLIPSIFKAENFELVYSRRFYEHKADIYLFRVRA
jgi:SAM-dependent methyltransferase